MSTVFAFTPGAYKTSEAYIIAPSSVGFINFSRPAPADRTDPNGDIESMAINVPRVDYSGEGCPVLLLDNSLTERCYLAYQLAINPNQMVWEVELSAASNTTGTERVVAMTDLTNSIISIGYTAVDNQISTKFFNNGSSIADITFDHSDNTILRDIKVLKNGTDILVKIDNVYIGGVFDATDLPTIEEMSYSVANTRDWMDGKTRDNTVFDDITKYDSTTTSWSQVVENISNLFTER